jgi:hypothetical protein
MRGRRSGRAKILLQLLLRWIKNPFFFTKIAIFFTRTPLFFHKLKNLSWTVPAPSNLFAGALRAVLAIGRPMCVPHVSETKSCNGAYPSTALAPNRRIAQPFIGSDYFKMICVSQISLNIICVSQICFFVDL